MMHWRIYTGAEKSEESRRCGRMRGRNDTDSEFKSGGGQDL